MQGTKNLVVRRCSLKHYNLASERIRIGMTQEDLANKLGYTVKTVGKWEKDISSMPSEVAQKAAALFCCSLDYLLDETDDRLRRTPRN